MQKLVPIFSFFASLFFSIWAQSQSLNPLNLTHDQHRAFLQAYSPIILGAAAEKKSEHWGHDWITNYYYDLDNDFSNNKRNWKRIIEEIRKGRQFDIRPTLYTSIIEFNGNGFDENGEKSLVLFYHIYRARDAGHIHDWERVELRLDNVNGSPLNGETVSYVVITEHSKHRARLGNKVEYYETPTGKHPLVYQADWRDGGFLSGKKLRKHELHFVEDSSEKIKSLNSRDNAEVNIDRGGKTPFHYIFVTGNDRQAVKDFSALEINMQNAQSLYSGVKTGKTVRMADVKRITLELQDVADIFPTHWVNPKFPNKPNPSWTGDIKILIDETPLIGEKKETIIPVSYNLYSFKFKSLEGDGEEANSGYPRSEWFWGTYELNGESFEPDIIKNDAKYKAAQLETPSEAPYYFWQHDFMVHQIVPSEAKPRHYWLPYGWHKAQYGGFDGRWTQLFADPVRRQ